MCHEWTLSLSSLRCICVFIQVLSLSCVFIPNFRRGSVQRQTSSAAISSPHVTPLKRNPFLECAALFWLGQSDRALRALCRGPAAEHNAYHNATTISGTFARKGASTVVMDGAFGLGICNRAIDVATRPFLVAKLQERENGSSKPRHERPGWPATGSGGGFSGPARNGGGGGGGVGSGGGGSNGVSVNKGHTLINAQRAAAVRLTTVEYLARNGMEISALEVLGSNAGGDWAAELATQQLADASRLSEPIEVAARTMGGRVDRAGELSSGAFAGSQGPASRAAPKPKAVASAAAASGELSGDMFGGFDGPPQKTAAAAARAASAASGELSGDMFGGFDGPPRPRPKPSPAPTASSMASGELSGGVFGDFDAAPPQRKAKQASAAAKAAAAASGELSGDMFGAFDAAPPQQKPKPAAAAASAASGELSGDMFGGFDGPPRTRQTPPATTASSTTSGELSGDMFGGFDTTPPQRKAKPAAAVAAVNGAAAASGELSGGMFGDFDAAPPRRRTPTDSAATPTTAVASGELSGDLFGGFDGPKRSPAAPVKTPNTSPKPRLSSPTAVSTGELSSDLFASFDGPPQGVGGRRDGEVVSSPGNETRFGVGNVAGSPSPRASSYGYFEGVEPSWEGYDKHVAAQNGETGGDPKTERRGKENVGA